MEKKFKSGLCLGKFMPIHNGHIHMIKQALQLCETVHIMVCSRLCEPISGYKRVEWVKEVFKDNDNVIVHDVDDENPQYPEDNPNFWQIWYDSVYSYVDELDAVFASEDYVEPFAECLGVEPVMVDRDRISVPISATDIRQNPFDNWEHIPTPVKEWYRLRIAVVGPESTGKTTLTSELVQHLNGVGVKEYGRWYTENKVDTKDLQPHDFGYIAGEQHIALLSAEREAEKNDMKYIISDTDANVTRMFMFLYSELNKWSDAEKEIYSMDYYLDKLDTYMNLQMCGQNEGEKSGTFDIFLLMYPDIDWEDDGTRDFDDIKIRLRAFQILKAQLDKHNCKYHIIKGNGAARTNKAIEIIDYCEKELREKEWHKLSFDR